MGGICMLAPRLRVSAFGGVAANDREDAFHRRLNWAAATCIC